MAEFSGLLGEKLLGKGGEVSTQEALSGKKAVALYFSAHWCPPCRGFTPKLAGWYKKDLQGKSLEVVFVSSDKGEAEFQEYYGEMPWLALPYSNREKKEELSKKYKVKGIPTVVLLGPQGELITTDGREAIAADPTGQDLPWKPKSFEEVFSGAKIITKDGQSIEGSSLKGKVFGLYFSAHWCPPCRGFTPQLAEWYKKDLKAKGFEVVFVSSDRDEGAFKEYYGEQPWLALAYEDRKRKEQLSSIFGIQGIPSLVIIGEDGTVINKDGRAAVSGDPQGNDFPWHPKPVHNLAAGPGDINEVATLLAFCEGCDAAKQKEFEAALVPLGEKYIKAAKAKGEDTPEIAVTMVTEANDLAKRLRGMLKLPEASGNAARLALIDIPDNGGYYLGPEGDVATATVEKFIADYSAKALTRNQLKG